MPVAYRHHVRYHETDSQGFLFNARYLEVADVAMTEYMRTIGRSYSELVADGFDPSLVKTEITFMRPIHFDEFIDISVECTRVGRSSFELLFTLRRDDVPVATVATTYVNVDTVTERSRPIPSDVVEFLKGSDD